MKYSFYPESGQFYKANLHTHSLISDGARTPEELKALYKARGYSVLCLTDHEIFLPHNDLTDPEFLMLNGCELQFDSFDGHGPAYAKVETTHLNLIAESPEQTLQPASDPDFDHPVYRWCRTPEWKAQRRVTNPLRHEYTAECVNEAIRLANQNGFLTVLNHPRWSGESFERWMEYRDAFAMEVFNTGSWLCGYPDEDGILFDRMLRSGHRMNLMAADDAHLRMDPDSPDADAFRGWICIKSARLDYASVISSLKSGDYYATNGPEITGFFAEDGQVKLETGPVRSIRLLTNFRWSGFHRAAPGETVTEASFRLHPETEWFRLEAEDLEGQKARTNPIRLSSLPEEVRKMLTEK